MTSVFSADVADTTPLARHVPQWDTNSVIIGIDNRCSGCMSHEAADFTGELKDCKRVIKGFGGTRHYNIKVGTLKWHWEDDHGRIHKFTIPHSYFVPEGGVRLLSPNIGPRPKMTQNQFQAPEK
jgi:hypothetical protein